MKREFSYDTYMTQTHWLGRIFSVAVLIMLVGAPFVIGGILGSMPDLAAAGKGFLAVGLVPENGAFAVTLWQRDDRMRLPGTRGERSLKRLCADAGITPAQRDTLPVFRVNGQAAAVPGLGVDLRFASEKEPTAYISFHQDIEESIV